MKNVIKSVAFLTICVSVFIFAVNPFFSGQFENVELRTVTDGFLELPEQTVDVLFISPSTYETFWQSPKAFHDTGMSAYGLTASGNHFVSYSFEIMQALKTQSPRLIVIDLVRLYRWINLVDTFRILSALRDDSIRSQFIEYVSEKLDLDEIQYSKTEFYVPFLRFHHNWKNINTVINAVLSSHIQNELFLGYYCNLNEQTNPDNQRLSYNTEQGFDTPAWDELLNGGMSLLPDRNIQVLNDFLDYCDTLDCDVLFVRCPQKVYFLEWNSDYWRTTANYISERGYTVLDTIPYYEEIALDYVNDYYDGSHTNYYGAEKFTGWLEQYLMEHYDLPDHRGDTQYAVWESEYQRLLEYVITNTQDKPFPAT